MRTATVLSLFCPILAFSQVYDNFADTNFTANPIWLGNTSAFIINTSNQLQINSSGSDTSILYTSYNSSLNNQEWRVWARLAFSPSDNNLARIYLSADQTNLEGALNGYFLQMGENGSFDSVDLWKKSGNSEAKIIDGINGHTAKSNNTLNIKVTRDSAGLWKLYCDTLGGFNYLIEGTVLDTTHKTSSYFGVYCKYTGSNATKFYFDDIYAGPIVIDTTGPNVDSVDVISSTQLDLYFNEPVEQLSAENTANYVVNNSIGTPSSAVLDAGTHQLIHLTFASNFLSGQQYIITANGIKDILSNTTLSSADTFLFYEALPNDIVINEIMADPDPALGLPNYEYIELHNTSTFPIKLNQWTFTSGSNTKIIPSFVLLPDSFVVLSSTSGSAALSPIANAIALSSFPSLTNTGQTLILKNNSGTIISVVSYTDKWYKDSNKEEGGFALEQIDPLNPCAGENNWKASLSSSGGTPGKINSVNTSNPDNIDPYIISASVIDTTTIQLNFNEPIDSASLNNILNFSINNGIGSPATLHFIPPYYSSIILTLSTPLHKKIIYIVTLSSAITDCKGNTFSTSHSIKIAIPEHAIANDVVINEILFDPRDNGVEFVEIYNRSNKIFELKNLRISSYDTITSQLSDIKIISPNGNLLFPGEYKLLSTNSSIVKSQYSTTASNEIFIQTSSLPALNNGGDIIVLSDTLMNIIDKVNYSPDMHYPLLTETKGVSLERIDFNRYSEEKSNWHSAASTVGFATPGYQNSQYIQYNGNTNIGISSEIFSPDNDGHNDVLTVHYTVEGQGYTGNIIIYNSNGGLVKHLIKNELLGAKGEYSWDGTNESRQKAPIGIYIVYFEAFNLEGNIEKHRIPCVLGGKLQ